MLEKKRGIKLVLLFFIIAIILVSSIFLFLKARIQTSLIEETTLPFKVDQILIKVLIKDDESMVRPINIIDISEYDLYIEIGTRYLADIVSVSENSFALKTGQTKTVDLTFSSFIGEKGIKQEPGIYVGSLITRSNSDIVKTPIIVEIETKEVLFDANIEVPVGQKQVKQGRYLDVQITIFNLKKIGLTNLNVEYFVKDISGNTIITETESIVVETQTSFVKTIHIPENLNQGEYVFGAVVRYGSSVGASTLLFEVVKPVVKEKNLLNYCRNSISCWIILGILAIIIVIILSYAHFLIGAFVHHKVVSPLKKPPKKKKEEKIVKKEIKPKEFKHKKLLLGLLYLVIISFIIAYLFYRRVITLEKLTYLWSLIVNWLENIAVKISELGKSIADGIVNLWNNTKPLLSNAYTNSLNWVIQNSQRRYFYHVLGIIIGLIAISFFMIIAKQTFLFEKLKARLEQRKAERAKKEEQLKKEEKKEVKKEIRPKKIIKKKFKIFENFKKLPRKGKIIILIIWVILLLIVLVSVLIDLGVLSIE